MIPLGLTATASAISAGIHKNVLGSGCPGILAFHPLVLLQRMTIITKKEMEDIKKVVSTPEDPWSNKKWNKITKSWIS